MPSEAVVEGPGNEKAYELHYWVSTEIPDLSYGEMCSRGVRTTFDDP